MLVFLGNQKEATDSLTHWEGEIFNSTETFYNPIKRDSHTDSVSSAMFEEKYFLESTTA